MRKDPPPGAFDKSGLAWVAFLELDHDVPSSMITPVYQFLYGCNRCRVVGNLIANQTMLRGRH